MGAAFFDSNVILYLTGRDPAKVAIARDVIRRRGVISVQVLNETARVLRKKFGFDWDDTTEFLIGVRAMCDVVPITLETHERGLAYAERYQLGVFDAMIVAAAVLAGCTTLYSEDMHHGLVIDGLTVKNPFRR